MHSYSLLMDRMRSTAVCCLLAAMLSIPSQGAETQPDAGYVVVVADKTLQDTAWKSVTDALQTKHKGILIRYTNDVRETLLELSIRRPSYVAFVAPPQEARPPFVWRIHRMMRELDEDPYTDAIWGIVTGYDAADALRIVKEEKPLLIQRGAAGTGGGSLKPFTSGFASSEGKAHAFFVKEDGEIKQREEKPDCIKALVDGFNTMKPQCFITSGHATPKDWTVGYTFKGGQFRCDKGQLYGLDTQGKRYEINSPEPKIYIPAGNCLIGAIPETDCMATALMHTGGVRQMFGYTVVTWFGYGGWGIKDLFLGQPGRFSFSEATYFNHQALLHQLATKHAKFADVRIPVYEPKLMQRVLGYVAQRHGIRGNAKQTLGLLWDRDVVTFYGDPAWEARMPKPQTDLPWTQSFTEADGKITFTIKTATKGKWPNRPVMARLPKRLDGIEVIEGKDLKPVVTDDFILVPLDGEFDADFTARVVFTGTPPKRDLEDLKKAEAALKGLTEKTAQRLRYELGRAGQNRAQLVAALTKITQTADEKEREAKQEALSFLIANMPRQDLRSVGKDLLLAHLKGALKARQEAPWKDGISEDLFLNYILPYACLDEKREEWRTDLQERFAKRAWEKSTPGEAACWLNRTIFKELKVSYHATKRPKPNQSPSESMKAGFASCSGLSIMLVDACRACGIPARIAGIPQWKKPNTDAKGQHGGNHMWVEIWDGSAWRCLGASEDSPLDKTWFMAKIKTASDARHWAHAIYATSWQRKGLSFPLVWNLTECDVSAANVTEAYHKKLAEKE